MAVQKLITAEGDYQQLDACLLEARVHRLFLVCGSSLRMLDISGYFSCLKERLGIQVVAFSGFSPNPTYESVVEGVRLFLDSGCDGIMAVGGGSAMDVAKCVKLYSNMPVGANYLEHPITPNAIPLFAAPTTAGTGSEATHFAVIYYNGEKQSVSDGSCIPSVVLFHEQFLGSLPPYQKKAAMLDALCHGIESFWSIHSTGESQKLSGDAIRRILQNREAYLRDEESAGKEMLLAAYQAGQAINLTQTTAGHAMSYKLTSLYGIAHGHAAALCVQKLWPYMLGHLGQCVDVRGPAYLEGMFARLAGVFGADGSWGGARAFEHVVSSLGMGPPSCRSGQDFEVLKGSVNAGRLKNNPIFLGGGDIDILYHEIVKEGENS